MSSTYFHESISYMFITSNEQTSKWYKTVHKLIIFKGALRKVKTHIGLYIYKIIKQKENIIFKT